MVLFKSGGTKCHHSIFCRGIKAILNSMIPDSISDGRKTEYNREIIRDRKEQPVR